MQIQANGQPTGVGGCFWNFFSDYPYPFLLLSGFQDFELLWLERCCPKQCLSNSKVHVHSLGPCQNVDSNSVGGA